MASKDKLITSFLCCPEIKAEIREAARQDDRTMSQTIMHGLKTYLELRKKKRQEDALASLTF
jgi:hypothetical protein